MGQEVSAHLDDPAVAEIMLNPDGQLFVRREGQPTTRAGLFSEQAAETLIETVALAISRSASSRSPIVSGAFPIGGYSFEGLVSPIVPSPVFCIRKRSTQLFSLDSYVWSGAFSKADANLVRQAVLERKNIIVTGRPGSGKTALANAILAEIAAAAPHDRMAVLEDDAELHCRSDNTVYLRSNDLVDTVALIQSAQRLLPDRIIVGEIKDRAAFDLLKSWTAGFAGGLATLAADCCGSALMRLEQLVSESVPSPMRELIGESVDLIIGLERSGAVQRLSGLLQVETFRDGQYCTSDVRTV